MKLIKDFFANCPPALMLLVIIFLAVFVTMAVTGRMSRMEADSSGPRGSVILTSVAVPSGTTIDKSMIEQARLSEVVLFQDAVTSMPAAVGRTTVHAIPIHAQVREIDLQ
ncbi:MAG: hypothetical protein AB7W16_23675 [Candidatus Obscuribacterales bacterium]